MEISKRMRELLKDIIMAGSSGRSESDVCFRMQAKENLTHTTFEEMKEFNELSGNEGCNRVFELSNTLIEG